MRKEIIVRKSSAQRHGLLIISLVFVCLSVLAIVLFYPLYHFGLISLLGSLPVLYILLYYERWRVSLCSKSITVRCLLRRTRSYTYSQLADGYIASSYTLHQHICLTFFDGRRLIIRAVDENAGKAIKMIQSHISLRNPEW